MTRTALNRAVLHFVALRKSLGTTRILLPGALQLRVAPAALGLTTTAAAFR